MEKLFKELKQETIYPLEITDITLETLKELNDVCYFKDYFSNDKKAVRIFFDRLCSSLIPKFLSGEELFWCEQGFEKIMNEAGVDYSIEKLEELNLIYVFDCSSEKVQDKILVKIK